MVRRNLMDKDEVRQMNVNMLVDSGVYMLTINDNIQEILQFSFLQRRAGHTADGRVVEMDEVGPVRVEFGNRTCLCSAMVLPRDSEPLLGAIPMEEMDLVILPKEQKLVVNPAHPEYASLRI